MYQETFKSLKVNFVNPRVEILDGFFQRLDFLDFHHYGNDRRYKFAPSINFTVFTDQCLALSIVSRAGTQKSSMLTPTATYANFGEYLITLDNSQININVCSQYL